LFEVFVAAWVAWFRSCGFKGAGIVGIGIAEVERFEVYGGI
jgi:hypothetical protein